MLPNTIMTGVMYLVTKIYHTKFFGRVSKRGVFITNFLDINNILQTCERTATKIKIILVVTTIFNLINSFWNENVVKHDFLPHKKPLRQLYIYLYVSKISYILISNS